MKNFLNEKEKLVDDLNTKISEKNQEIIKITSENEEIVDQMNTLKRNIENIQNDNNANEQLLSQIKEKDKIISSLNIKMSEVVAEKEKFENQIKLIENDRGSCYEISKNSEKKLKDDLIKLRGVIDAKRGEIQELNDLVEKLKNENENYRSQIKS